jgi:hypothetical protein
MGTFTGGQFRGMDTTIRRVKFRGVDVIRFPDGRCAGTCCTTSSRSPPGRHASRARARRPLDRPPPSELRRWLARGDVERLVIVDGTHPGGRPAAGDLSCLRPATVTRLMARPGDPINAGDGPPQGWQPPTAVGRSTARQATPGREQTTGQPDHPRKPTDEVPTGHSRALRRARGPRRARWSRDLKHHMSQRP